MNQILHNIEKLVKENEIKMIPRYVFWLRTGAVSVGIFIIMLCVIYALSLLVFMARRNGPPTFGMRDILFNLDTLPIIIIAFSLVGMLFIEILSRKFTFAYRAPSLIVFLSVILIVSCASYCVDRLMFHDRMHDMFMRNRFDRIDVIYQRPFIRGMQPATATFIRIERGPEIFSH